MAKLSRHSETETLTWDEPEDQRRYTSTTFWRKLNCAANPEFQKVMEECAVIYPLPLME